MERAMDYTVIVKTASGQSLYRFKLDEFGNVGLETGSPGQPVFDPYHTFRPGTDRGAAAIRFLMERCHQLETFFEAARVLSVTNLHGGALTGFIERQDADEPELEDAYEIVAEMIEEADRRDEEESS